MTSNKNQLRKEEETATVMAPRVLRFKTAGDKRMCYVHPSGGSVGVYDTDMDKMTSLGWKFYGVISDRRTGVKAIFERKIHNLEIEDFIGPITKRELALGYTNFWRIV